MKRKAELQRKTTETTITLKVDLDGTGCYNVDSGIPFLDHMLNLFAKHSLIDLEIKAEGDLNVDFHHTIEDLGLTLGAAIAKALGDKIGIKRYGFFKLPMDEALAEVAIDLSGRSYISWDVDWNNSTIKDFESSLVEEFWRAFTTRLNCTLHITSKKGRDGHHICEAIFKCVARALEMAIQFDKKRQNSVASTKGTLVD